MCNENKNNNNPIFEISELTHSEKRVDFSIESSNTKPFDIQLMTGNLQQGTQNQNNRGR